MMFVTKKYHKQEIARLEKAYQQKFENGLDSVKRKNEHDAAPQYKITSSYCVQTNADVYQIEEKTSWSGVSYVWTSKGFTLGGAHYQPIYSGTKPECEIRLKRLMKNAEKK